MDQQEQKLIDRIKQAQNVLVTVSLNPSVDQLAAAIGLTIALNKMDKHGTAVFSGQVPSTIEFLKPEETLERNTDSLRDFIIALDKSKADKLRYKVEDQVVRIFITPYKTSLSQKDLEFSQGDFNVDVVVALGVADQKDIDVAITAHGRILHDATVTSIGLTQQGNVGTINWVNTNASSLSEMMLGLIDGLDKKLLDNQIATALLTGIVASTDRFRNEKTSPKAMSASAELMAAGANQQLIATELEPPLPPPPPEPEPKPEPEPHPEPEPQMKGDSSPAANAPAPGEQIAPTHSEPGELDINHDDDVPPPDDEDKSDESSDEVSEPPKPPEPEQPQIHVDEDGTLRPLDQQSLAPEISQVHGVESDGSAGEPAGPSEVHHERLTQPPSLGDVNLTANTTPDEDEYEPTTEELTLPSVSAPLLKHNESVLGPTQGPPMEPEDSPFIPQAPLQPAPLNWVPPEPPPLLTPPPMTPLLPPLQSTPLPVSPSPVPSPQPMMLPPIPESSGPLVPMPAPPALPDPSPSPFMPPVTPAASSPGFVPSGTLADIEQAVRSSHAQPTQPAPNSTNYLDDARSAVQAAFNGSGPSNEPLQPVAALNAMPLGSELHPESNQPMVPNAGFSEPTPGNTPADAALDMPLPSSPFGPGQQPSTSPLSIPSPSVFPGAPPQQESQGSDQTPPPPVPPPMLPPL